MSNQIQFVSHEITYEGGQTWYYVGWPVPENVPSRSARVAIEDFKCYILGGPQNVHFQPTAPTPTTVAISTSAHREEERHCDPTVTVCHATEIPKLPQNTPTSTQPPSASMGDSSDYSFRPAVSSNISNAEGSRTQSSSPVFISSPYIEGIEDFLCAIAPSPSLHSWQEGLESYSLSVHDAPVHASPIPQHDSLQDDGSEIVASANPRLKHLPKPSNNRHAQRQKPYDQRAKRQGRLRRTCRADSPPAYGVRAILDSDIRIEGSRTALYYFVHWESDERTWEPAENVDNCNDLLAEYYSKRSATPGNEEAAGQLL
ncbi:hypothetical protein NA57DRAFT_72231 [Rhizodiscina lignyota]|uniref:Chromo domain-containing protein n=1 Tax=Rhizodiscina lignyota TaxID=1504668 RepID=A0A9P4MAH3_9PEZI|nr:hypothetical protein NA57DRAFT_72231 [Rhizodiscina lignyota]